MSLTRGLANLATRWDIQDPDFDFVNRQFMLKWEVSDYIQDHFASYSVSDGFDCKEGSNDITDSISNFNDNQVFFQTLGLRPDANTEWDSNPETSGNGFRDFRLFLAIQADTIAQAPIYYTTGGEYRAKIDFCVRFSLYNDSPSTLDATEVNFHETLISLNVDLTDGFEVDDINVVNKDRNQETANIACEVTGYECDLQNKPLTNPGYLR
jgi:hypothetical protein